MQSPINAAIQIAAQALSANIVCLESGCYLTAGHHQFRTLWTRDFCHSVKGLLLINRADVVENHLNLLIKSARPQDGLVPRVLDNRLVQLRVIWESARHLVPQLPSLILRDPLRPQYMDEHGSCAIDSNLLVLQASLELVNHSRDWAWWHEREDALKRIFDWYDNKIIDGLIHQPSFSDWQDSARRRGPTFLTNLLYFTVAQKLQSLGWSLPIDIDGLKGQMKQKFWSPSEGVFLSVEHSPLVSLDGNLLALTHPDFLSDGEKTELWTQLKNHPLVKGHDGLLGQCSHPNYPTKDLAWHIRLARFHTYHSQMAWSWLMGLSLSTALLMKDQAAVERQSQLLVKVLLRDSTVYEVYSPHQDWMPYRSWLLESEHPFAWGAAYITQAFCLVHGNLYKPN